MQKRDRRADKQKDLTHGSIVCGYQYHPPRKRLRDKLREIVKILRGQEKTVPAGSWDRGKILSISEYRNTAGHGMTGNMCGCDSQRAIRRERKEGVRS